MQRKAQKLESLIAILGEGLERAAEIIAIGIEMQIDRQVFELLVEGNGIVRARAFVEHARQEMGDARLVLRVLRRPAREGELNGDQRVGVILDKPGLDAAWRNHLAYAARVAPRPGLPPSPAMSARAAAVMARSRRSNTR